MMSVLRRTLALAFLFVISTDPADAMLRTQHFGADGWILRVDDDPFTGTRICVLRSKSGSMLYQPGAIGFRVRDRDTLSAVYRLDDGRLVRWQDRYPALIAAGVEVDGPGLANPTDRIVWIPEADLTAAHVVAIRVGDRGYGRRFVLRGSKRMIAATHALGCTIMRF